MDEAKIIVERYENYHAALAYLAENGVPERYWEEMGITPENVEQAKFVVEQYLDDEALKAEIRELHDALLSYQSQIEQEELDMLAEIQSTIAADLTPWLDSLFIAYANELIQDAEKQASENGNEQDPLGIVVCYSISFIPGVGNVVDAWSELVEGKDRCTGKEASIESKTLTFVSLFADVIDWADTIKDMEKAMEASKAADRLGTLAKLDPQDIEAIRDASRLDFVLDAARVDAMSDVARYAGKDADLITSLFELRKLSRQVEKSGNLIDKVLLFQKINYLKTTGKWEDVIRYANKINGVNAEESLRMAGLLSESIEAKQWDNIVDAMKQAGGKYDNLATTAEAIKDLRSAEKFLATPGVLDAEQAVTARYLMQMIMKGSGVSDELRDLLKKTEQIGPVKDLIRANKWDENIEMYASFRLRPRTAAWKVWAFERITESQFLKEVVEDGVENVFEKVNDHFYTCITNNMSCWDIVENYDMPADQLHSYIQLRLTDYRALSALGYSTNVFFSTEPPTQVKDLLNSEGISWYTPSKLP